MQLSWLQQQVTQLPDRSPDGFAHQDVTGGHAWAGIERVSFDPACQSARRVNPAEGSARTAAEPPRIPASAGALVWDRKGRLLILKPTYKSGWTIPGGEVEADGETPWEACRRETHEECGLDLRNGRLVCVDFLRPRPGRPGGMRFLFDCCLRASCCRRRRSPSTGWRRSTARCDCSVGRCVAGLPWRSRSLDGCTTSRTGAPSEPATHTASVAPHEVLHAAPPGKVRPSSVAS